MVESTWFMRYAAHAGGQLAIKFNLVSNGACGG